MRKSLHETGEIERYLQQEMPAPEKALFEAKMIIVPGLQEKVYHQRKTYQLIRWFARWQQKKKLEAIHRSLMNEPRFRESIHSIFS